MKRANTASVPWWKLDADEIERHEWADLRPSTRIYANMGKPSYRCIGVRGAGGGGGGVAGAPKRERTSRVPLYQFATFCSEQGGRRRPCLDSLA